MALKDDLIQSAVQKVKNFASGVSSKLSDQEGWFRGGQFTPIKQISEFRVGNNPTLGEATRQVLGQGLNNAFNPYARIAEGRSLAPLQQNTQVNYSQPLRIGADITNQGLKNYLSGITFNLVEPKMGTAQTTAGKITGIGTNLLGAFTSPASKFVFGKTGKFGEDLTRSATMKFAPKLAGTFASKVLPQVGGEVAQTLSYAGLSKLGSKLGLNEQKDQFSPSSLGTNLVAGLGFRAAPAIISKALSSSRGSIHPEDVNWLERANDVLRSKQSSPKAKQDAKNIIYSLSERYMTEPERVALGDNPKLLANRLIKYSKDIVGSGSEPIMGIKEVTQQKGAVPQKVQAQTKPPKTKVSKLTTLEQQGYDPNSPVTKEIAKVTANKPSTVSISPKGRLNTKNLNISEEAKLAIDEMQSNVPVTVIGNKDVIERSKSTTGRKTAMTDEQMQNNLAQQLNTRQEVVSLQREFDKLKASGASIDELVAMKAKIAEQSRIAQQQGTFAGRLLQSQNILANEYATPEQKIYALLENAGVKPERYLKDAVNVDFNNPTQVVEFYRKFVPAKFTDILTEVRYTNMLSSPLTQIVNTFSNVLQSGIVKPIEKTITGGLDFISSKLTGKERQYFASQGIDYTKGYYSAIPEAFTKFKNIVTGKEINISPDYEHIPTTIKGPLKAYTTPLRILEATDQFFRTLVTSGEKRSLARLKLSDTELLKRAEQSADYTLFRQKFDPDGKLGQGAVLKTWDKWNSAIQMLRRVPGGNWVLPFIQTPTNILKQGLEYSPLGVITMIGAKQPLEQLSKSIIGTAAFMSLYGIADKGGTTWDVPTNPKEKELFYASGLQPYSVKIGNNWVSYSKLGPLSYPLAMASALKWVEKNNPDQNVAENLRDALGQMLGFFGDQSYVQSIGDLISAIQSSTPNKLASAVDTQLTNFVGQLVPYRSFQGWLTRMIDPTYRKPEGMEQSLMAQTPILSTQVPAYTDLQGQPSQRDYPVLNSFSPLKISQEKSNVVPLLQTQESNRIARAVDTKQFESGGNEAVKSGNIIFYTNENGNRAELDLSKLDDIAKLPSTNRYEKAIKESKQYSTAATILDNNALTKEQRLNAIARLGVDPDKAEYYRIANDNTNAKTMFVLDALDRAKTNGIDPLRLLQGQRTQINGQMIASNAVLDNLVDEGVLTYAQAKELKKYKFENGQLVKMGKGRVSTKKIKIPKLKKIKVKSIKIKKAKKLKFKPVKLAKPKKIKVRRLANT